MKWQSSKNISAARGIHSSSASNEALVGRVEVRDGVDVIHCDSRLQPLGYLAWAACGKDPGFSPPGSLDCAARSSRYSAAEVAGLAFAGTPPDAGELGRRWHSLLEQAQRVVALLPAGEAGKCVLDAREELLCAPAERLATLLAGGEVRFHPGRIRGAWPQLA